MAKTVPARGLTANDSTARGAVGQLYIREGKSYRYWKVKDINVIAGSVVEYSSSANCVTGDRSGGTSIGRVVAGVAAATITAGNYGWIQVAGTCSVRVAAKGVVAAGNPLAPHATTDNAVTSTITYSHTTSTTGIGYQVFAYGMGDDTATTTAAGLAAVVLTKVN